MKSAKHLLVVVSLGCALAIGMACKNAGAAKISAEVSQVREPANAGGSGPGIDLNCVIEKIQTPKESFAYSFTKDTSDETHIAQEADVSPQSIDGRARHAGSDHAAAFQATRSDEMSWSSAVANLTAIAGMSSTIAIVNHTSAMKREADGRSMNGYSTIHYSIDSSRFDAAEQKILGMTMGPGGLEKGDAWVTADGCPVKLVIDSELHKNDGSLDEKIRYEESMVKK